MKAAALFVFIMALCLLVIPMIALNYQTEAAVDAETPAHNPAARQTGFEPADTAPDPVGLEETDPGDDDADDDYNNNLDDDGDFSASAAESVTSFKILDQSTGKVNEVPLRDFVRGAVAAEMPASFHSEALKAQAVAAHTFALHSHITQQESPDLELKGADFAADPGDMKVYITEETAKEFYGDDADFYWNKICTAADSVLDCVLEYDGEPIVAAYHAISAGMTEDASNIWIGSAPYLLAVQSEGDLLAPGYESTVSFTAAEVSAALEAEYPDIGLAGDPSGWFGEPARSASGYVTEIAVGDQYLHGKDIRRVFDLRSHNFEIGYDGGEFVFTVTGYGHGVGLSQYGADFLARQGKTFGEILETYYTGATIKKLAGR